MRLLRPTSSRHTAAISTEGAQLIVLRYPQHVALVQNPEIRRLLDSRFAYLSEDEPYDPETMADFVVMQAEDRLQDVNAVLGFDILCNRFSGVRFDQEGFHQSFEVLEEHRTCFEFVFVLSDDGFGVIVFVPKEPVIHPDLLALCERYAIPAEESQP